MRVCTHCTSVDTVCDVVVLCQWLREKNCLCCVFQLKQMEQKLKEYRAKAGIVADVKARSSVEGFYLFMLSNFCCRFCLHICCIVCEIVNS